MSLNEQQIRAIVKDELRKIIDAGLMYTESCKPQEPAKQEGPFDKLPQLHDSTQTKGRTIDDIRQSFPEELDNRLSFSEKGDYIILKPNQFLGSETFAKIASAVRGMGGEYISAGYNSHFRVPREKQQ